MPWTMAGNAPQCSGSTTCWPMSRPSASVNPQLPSWLSRTIVEKPVRNSELVTSRTMPDRLVAITCRVTGSMLVRAAVAISAASRDVYDQVQVAVHAGRLSRVDDGGRVELLDDRRALQPVARLQPRPVVHRTVHEATQLAEVDRPRARSRRLHWLAARLRRAQLHLRHAHHGHQAVVDGLDRRCRRLVPVEPLVQAVEALAQPTKLRGIDRYLYARHGQLVALAGVAHVQVVLEPDLLGREALRR